ncbi:GNAT family N-acetyltransferase [Flavobacterium wongokense]|uniref:GNAT family N-acetyltransferase n=1 Tax=Flavobacterium wongokense TaxID=2910674 RepID=UPI001F4234AB|nr:GNAT family N-acetyltransferase [Flavobacterium sp. WG47]MCF6131985.1 GNAT family N-acetyltransferase [Flavobacterium sp. WG47]
MDNITIRKASFEDLKTLLDFEQGVIDAERAFDSTLKTHDAKYYNLEEMLTMPHIQFAVAEVNHEIIASGYARIETSEPYLQHEKHAYLGFMYVLPEYRGQGINRKIIDYLKDWAQSQEITELRLEVYFDNSPAISAYEKFGFSRHMIEMRMSIK